MKPAPAASRRIPAGSSSGNACASFELIATIATWCCWYSFSQLRERLPDVLHVRTMRADERHDERRCVREIAIGDGLAVQISE